MMDNTKIEVGYALPKERWQEAADNPLLWKWFFMI